MAITTETTVKINTDPGVDSLKKLREQAKQYRQEMESAEIGSEKFSEAQRNLSKVSDQVKNALMLGTKEIDQTNQSYDSLVRTMSELTKAWRATGDEAERAKLGAQILEINTQLKTLDASRGNFQRNVGNYSSAFDGLSTSMSQVVRELPSLQMGLSTFVLAISNNLPILADNIAKVNIEIADLKAKGDKSVSTIGAIAKSLKSWNTVLMLVIAGVQLIVSNWDKISKLWRDDTPQEKATKAIEAMNKAIERQNDLVSQKNTELLRQYTEELRKVGGDADKAKEALERYNQALRDNTLAQAEANRATAGKRVQDLDLEIAKASAHLEEVKKSMEAVGGTSAVAWYVDDIKEAEKHLKELQGIRAEAKTELDKYAGEVVKAEHDIVKAQADADIENADKWRREQEDRYDQAEAIKELYQHYETEFYQYVNQLEQIAIPDFEEYNTAFEEQMDKEVEIAQRTVDKILKERERQDEESRKMTEANIEKERRLQEQAERERERRNQQRVQSVSNMFGALALLQEENTTEYKAFAVAQAVIDTYASAAAALKNGGGMPWAAINVAASIATGLAQVHSILAVDTSGESTPNMGGGAIVSAPAVVQQVPITRTLTDTSAEERLNAKLADLRVYVVYSDIEEVGKQVDVQRSESSF